MKKGTFTSILLLAFMASSFAQNPEETKSDYNKKMTGVNAVMITLPSNIKSVEPVVAELFKTNTKIKGKTDGDTRIFEGVVFPQISPNGLNYGYKVEKAAKNDERNTRVTIFVANTANEFLSSAQNPTEIDNTKKLLASLPLEIEIYEKNEAIQDQNKAIDKVELKGKALEKEANILQTTLKETQEKIEKNKVAQAEQVTNLATEKTKLTTLQVELEALKAKK